MRESEAMAHVGSWLWDLRTGAVQWSDEFHRIHGVDPLDFDGTFESHIGTVHPEDQDRVRGGIEESVASGRPFEDEYRVVRPDREISIVHARAQPTVGSAGSRARACEASARTSPTGGSPTATTAELLDPPAAQTALISLSGACVDLSARERHDPQIPNDRGSQPSGGGRLVAHEQVPDPFDQVTRLEFLGAPSITPASSRSV